MNISTMSYLYLHNIQNKEIYVCFLKTLDVLPNKQTCNKIKNQTICDSERSSLNV